MTLKTALISHICVCVFFKLRIGFRVFLLTSWRDRYKFSLNWSHHIYWLLVRVLNFYSKIDMVVNSRVGRCELSDFIFIRLKFDGFRQGSGRKHFLQKHFIKISIIKRIMVTNERLPSQLVNIISCIRTFWLLKIINREMSPLNNWGHDFITMIILPYSRTKSFTPVN